MISKNFKINKFNNDNIHEDYLSKIVYAFQENPNLKLVSSRIQKFGYAHDEYVLPEYSYKRLFPF